MPQYRCNAEDVHGVPEIVIRDPGVPIPVGFVSPQMVRDTIGVGMPSEIWFFEEFLDLLIDAGDSLTDEELKQDIWKGHEIGETKWRLDFDFRNPEVVGGRQLIKCQAEDRTYIWELGRSADQRCCEEHTLGKWQD